ncbi:hypothetical protein [Photobacterium leiognathi]|uniref:hypothetical protein n=1 Tax=Photobacterium leiognathi TaxID=553611 RepID=UPI0029815C16|nr:hypothetical protein [Photobacterium leiognathi]
MGLSGAGHSLFTSIVMLICFLSPAIVVIVLTLMKFFNYATNGEFASHNITKSNKLERKIFCTDQHINETELEINRLKAVLANENSMLEQRKKEHVMVLAKRAASNRA